MMNTPVIHTIDLQFMDNARAIAAFAVVDARGITLVECGPFSTHSRMLAGLEAAGLDPADVHSLLLTHIHFDHAGAAWWWAARGVQVYVHPRGQRHLIAPERLYQSAARIYGTDNMHRMWGAMESIEAESVTAIADREMLRLGDGNWTAHHTPGHASHHIAWQLDEVVFTGDVGGVKIADGPVVPPCPPPDIDFAAWSSSIARLRALGATTFYLTHFGAVPATLDHLDQLQTRLKKYVTFVEHLASTEKREAVRTELFTEFVEDEFRALGLDADTIAAYRLANPPGMSVGGILRWLQKRTE